MTPEQFRALEDMMDVRRTLIDDIGDDDQGRGTIRSLELAIAAFMPVRTLDGAGKLHLSAPVTLAECFPDDPDAIAMCMDSLGRGERFRDGGGAAPIYEIERFRLEAHQ